MSVQKELVGAVTSAAGGAASISSTFEKMAKEKEKEQPSKGNKLSQVRSASEQAKDSLNAAREEQNKKKAFSSSMKEKLATTRKGGK